MKERIVASALAVLLSVSVFSGCAGKSSSASSGSSASASSSSSQPYTVKIALMTMNGAPKNLSQVEDAIDKISVPAENVKIDIDPISYAQWTQEMNLMLAGNEKLDVTVTLPNTYTTYVAQGKFQPMDDLLQKYGQGIVKAYNDLGPDFLNACKVNGKIYGIAQMREWGSEWGFCIRKDIADALKMDNSKALTLDQAEAYLKEVKEKYPNMTPLMPQTGGSAPNDTMIYNLQSWDNLGDGFGVLMNEGQDTPLKVQDLYETSQYADLVNTMHRWYNEGILAKDASTTNDSAVTRIKAGTVAAMAANMKPGFDVQEQGLTGMAMKDFTIIPAHAGTADVSSFVYGIPNNCKDTVSTMKMLNLLYTNADIMNLMCWGIEGTDYVKTSTPGVITYPSGKTSNDVVWCQGLAWEMGNEFLSYVMSPNPKDLWEQTKTFDRNIIKSKAMGFNFDGTPVKSQITAVTNVQNQYAASLEDGAVDPKTVLPQFISALKANGIADIMKEKQSQLNKWLKANGHDSWIPQ